MKRNRIRPWRKAAAWLTGIALLAGGALFASAVDPSQSYTFDVSANGTEYTVIEPGETVEVELSLSRTDTDSAFMNIYSVSAVLRFHSSLLDLEDLQTGTGVSGTVTELSGSLKGWTDVTLNYLAPSMSGVQWKNGTTLATLRLKATGRGATQMQLRRGSVSTYNGMQSFRTGLGRAVVTVQRDRAQTQTGLEVVNYTETPGGGSPAEVAFGGSWAELTVKSDQPCAVMLINAEGAVTTLKPQTVEDTHTFFAEGAVGNETIAVAFKGDTNLDGAVDLADAAMVKASYLGRLPLTDLQAAAANVTGATEIGLAEASIIKAGYLGKYTLAW